MSKKHKHDSEFKCSLCSKKAVGFGNNPEPLRPFDERCCDECNVMKVIPARLHNVFSLQQKKADKDTTEPSVIIDDYEADEAIPEPTVTISDDPYYNLLGALHDLEQDVNDEIVRDTIRRVLFQIKPKRLNKYNK